MSISVLASNGLLRLNDLESVDWVFNEVEQLLKHAQKVLHLYLLEETRHSSDSEHPLPPLGPLCARIKQSAGALRMVDIEVVATVLDSLEQVMTSFINNAAHLNAQTVQVIDKACLAVVEFLQIALKGKAVYPIGLFQPYQALSQIMDVHVQPSDLWSYEFHWQDVDMPAEMASEQEQQEAIKRLDKFMLSLLRGRLSAAEDFKTIATGLARKVETGDSRRFWQLVAGFFDALCARQVGLNINTKRAATQVLNAYKAHLDGSFTVDEPLGKVLLFFCVKVKGAPGNETAAPILDAVRKAYHIDGFDVPDFERVIYGRIDPLQLKQIQGYIAQAKAVWSAVCSGETIPSESVINIFRDVCQALASLIFESRDFVKVLYETVGTCVTSGQTPAPEIAMEVATAVLYIEAVVSDTDFNNEELKEKFTRISQRIEVAIQNGKILPLDPWIRTLYHNINERETISNVVSELRVMLHGIEGNIDDFLRKSKNAQMLSHAVADLRQMSGVLNVLGMDSAVQSIRFMQEQVNWLVQQAAMHVEVSQEQEQVVLLIENLSSIGFLIDMLGYQPMLARELFVYNSQTRKLELLSSQDRISKQEEVMNRQDDALESLSAQAQSQEAQDLPVSAPAQETAQAENTYQDTLLLADEKGAADVYPDTVLLAEETEKRSSDETDNEVENQSVSYALEAEPLEATDALVDTDTDIDVEATEELKPLVAEAPLSVFEDTLPMDGGDVQAQVPASGPGVLSVESEGYSLEMDDGTGDDLREIFLEEANEVVESSRLLLQQLYDNLQDRGALTSLRRSFHSLKGSSRMVGLMDFGSAAYACEQCFNEWLDVVNEKAIPKALIDFAAWALDQFELWTKELQSGQTAVSLIPELFEQEAHLVSVALFPDDTYQSALVDEHVQTGDQDDIVLQEDDERLDEDAHPEVAFDEFSTLQTLDIPSQSGHSEWPATLPLEVEEDKAHQAYEQTKELLSNLSLSLEEDRKNTEPQPIPSQAQADTEALVPEVADDAQRVDFAAEEVAANQEEEFNFVLDDDMDDAQVHHLQTASSPDGLQTTATTIEHIKTALARWQADGDVPALQEAQEEASVLVELLRKVGYIGLASFAQDFESGIQHFYQTINGQAIPQDRSSTLIFDNVADELKRLLDQFSKGQTDMPRMDLLIKLYQFQQNGHAFAGDANASTDVSFEFAPEDAEYSEQTEEQAWDDISVDEPAEISNEDPAAFDEPVVFNETNEDQHLADEAIEPVSEQVAQADFAEANLYTDPDPEEASDTDTYSAEVLSIYQKLHPGDREAVISDIFEVFNEEAKDLLPLLSSGLREWSIRPSVHAKLVEVLRLLHTFKGSARMSAAMHLGDMAHDLESQLKTISEQSTVSEDQITDVLNNLDDLEIEFENLRIVYTAYASGDILLDELRHSVAPQESVSQEAAVADEPLVHSDVVDASDKGEVAGELAPSVADVVLEEAEDIPTIEVDAQHIDHLAHQEITPELFAVFKEETSELLTVIRQGLVDWLKSAPSFKSALNDVMRALHTLKGNTRLVSANNLAQSVRELELTLAGFEVRVPTYPEGVEIQSKLSQVEAGFELFCKAQESYAQSDDSLVSEVVESEPVAADHIDDSESQPDESDVSLVEEPVVPFEQTCLQAVENIATQLSNWCDNPVGTLDTAAITHAVDVLHEQVASHYQSNDVNGLLDLFLRSVNEQGNQPFNPDAVEQIILNLREVELSLHIEDGQGELYSDVLMRQLMNSAFNDSIVINTDEDDLDADTQGLDDEDLLEQDEIAVELQDTDSVFHSVAESAHVPDVYEPEVLVPATPVKEEQEPAPAPEFVLEQPPVHDDDASSHAAPAIMHEQKPLPGHAIRKDIKPRLIKPSSMRKEPSKGVGQMLRVRATLIDELVNMSGELNLQRNQLVSEFKLVKDSLLPELISNLDRLRTQLRDIEIQAETQMASRIDAARAEGQDFDPLEFDRFTRIQELTRMMAESVSDIGTVQKSLRQSVANVEDSTVAQARSSKEMQHALLRARMVEFSSITERFYRVVRMAARESDKQAQLTITGGDIEVDRVVLERVAPAFEHMLRNCVVHGIETPARRRALGKPDSGQIKISLHQEGNDVSISITDDGEGLNLDKIKAKAISLNLVAPGAEISEHDLAQLIFKPDLTTATKVTELAGRGVGLDMAYSETIGLGGRVEVFTKPNQGTEFIVVLPLTTAVTQVLLVSVEGKTFGIPVGLVESIRRFIPDQVRDALQRGKFDYLGEEIPAYSMSGLLNLHKDKHILGERKLHWLILHSGGQRIAIAVDNVISNQEVVIRNVGVQFSYLSGFAGMTVLTGEHVVLIYNPVVLSRVFAKNGDLSQFIELPSEEHGSGLSRQHTIPGVETLESSARFAKDQTSHSNKVMVVDDSLTVRRVTQRLLEKAGFDVVLAKDGQDALEQIHNEIPAIILTDIEMPIMDGFELVRQLRQNAKTQGLPIIMITSRIAQKHHDYANELGVNYYLGKPYVEEELLGLVRRYVSQSKDDRLH